MPNENFFLRLLSWIAYNKVICIREIFIGEKKKLKLEWKLITIIIIFIIFISSHKISTIKILGTEYLKNALHSSDRSLARLACHNCGIVDETIILPPLFRSTS